ncbi:unnamed protein product, partial [Didymodactylos carnosus]
TLVFTWIMIPYYPWKITHQSHHKNTNNMEKDEAFFPKRGTTYKKTWVSKAFLWTPGLIWDVPWFADDKWSYIEGQLSTVDRHYGHVHSIIHSIGTHQIHHLFPKIPHYHLEEATVHFRKAFPNLVRLNYDRILPSFVRMAKKLIWQRNIGKDVSVFTYSDDKVNN